MIEQAATVCSGHSGHPGLDMIEDLDLVTRPGSGTTGFALPLFECGHRRRAPRGGGAWQRSLDPARAGAPTGGIGCADWESGILGEASPGEGGILDHKEPLPRGARLSTLSGLWTDRAELLIDRSTALDISMLGPVIPLGLLRASDSRMVRTAEAILRNNAIPGNPNLLAALVAELGRIDRNVGPGKSHSQDVSSLATLWMARYLIRLGRETGHGRH